MKLPLRPRESRCTKKKRNRSIESNSIHGLVKECDKASMDWATCRPLVILMRELDS